MNRSIEKKFVAILAAAMVAASVGICLGQDAGAGGNNNAGANAGAANPGNVNPAGGNAGPANAGGGGGNGNQRGGRANFGGNGRTRGNFAGGQGGPPAPPGVSLVGVDTQFYADEYQSLIVQLTLTDDQKNKLSDEVSRMNTELETVFEDGQPAGRNRRGRFGQTQANATTDPAATAPDTHADPDDLSPQQLTLQDNYLQVADAHQLAIDALLTDDQKLQWEGFKLNRLFAARLNQVGLNETQKTKVKELVDETAKAILTLKDAKDIELLKGRMLRRLADDVLNEQQAAKFLEQPSALAPPVEPPPAPPQDPGGFMGGRGGGRGGRSGRGGFDGGAVGAEGQGAPNAPIGMP